MSETCQASAKAQVGSESDEDRIVVFYSLSRVWQVVIKGRIRSSLLIVQPHIFSCNSFVWPCLSSFEWAASPWVPSTIDIFPANDAAPWPQGFSHGMEFSHGGTTVSQCVANGAGQGVDFFPPLSVDRQALHCQSYWPPLPGEIYFFWWLYKDHLACKFCLSQNLC